MSPPRSPKAVGTYGLLDVIHRPSRLGRVPPDPRESLNDVHAVQRGEARRVSCFLRVNERRVPRQGELELSNASVSWRPFFGIRRKGHVVKVTGVVLVRQADWLDQRFGVPVNLHLFTLVRCSTPTGRLDLLVPTADVPLVTWCLGGKEDALTEASIPLVQRRPKMSRREMRWRVICGSVCLVIALITSATGYGPAAILLMGVGAELLASATLERWKRRRGGGAAARD